MSDTGKTFSVPRELHDAECARLSREAKEMEDAAEQGGTQLLDVMRRQHAEAAARMAEVMLRAAYECGRRAAMEREEAILRAIAGNREDGTSQ